MVGYTKPKKFKSKSFIKETKAINIETNKNFFVLMTSSHRRHYRLINVCFKKNLEIRASSSLSCKQKHSGFKQRKIFLLWCRNHVKVINMIRLLDGCFNKNLEIHVSSNFSMKKKLVFMGTETSKFWGCAVIMQWTSAWLQAQWWLLPLQSCSSSPHHQLFI